MPQSTFSIPSLPLSVAVGDWHHRQAVPCNPGSTPDTSGEAPMVSYDNSPLTVAGHPVWHLVYTELVRWVQGLEVPIADLSASQSTEPSDTSGECIGSPACLQGSLESLSGATMSGAHGTQHCSNFFNWKTVYHARPVCLQHHQLIHFEHSLSWVWSQTCLGLP
jgi:hypothetical protein